MSDASGSDQQALRAEIDRLDGEIQRLIGERAEQVLAIARLKEADGGPFYRPGREAQVLDRIAERNSGPLPDADMVRIFRELMSASLALERRLRVAYLGPEATFSHSAVLTHFGTSVEALSVGSFAEVFREVDAGQADYGVVPVENSTEGPVNATLDLFSRYPLAICGELALRIEHHLMAGEGKAVPDLERVYIHPQTRAQCREWLAENLGGVELVEVASNAEAARRAAAEPGAGAVAGEMAAERYNLTLLVKGIEDDPENTTRFVVVGHEDAEPSGRDKTSVVVSAPNRPGSLLHMLQPFADAGVNLTKIVSRPARDQLWEYVFFLDLEGHRSEPVVAEALAGVEANGGGVRVLGSYPHDRLGRRS